MPEFDHFAGRLTLIIGKRRPYPWAQSVGITRGSINRILNEGKVPGGDMLARIAQVEGASITWLLTGRGEPFLVQRAATDAATAERLQAHLADESWEVHLLEDGRRGVVVLAQPAEMGEGDEAVRYTAVELIAGPWGVETADILREHASSATHVQSAVIDDAWHGQLGAHQALELIRHGTAPANQVAEIASIYGGGGAHTPDEKAWLDAWHRLSPGNRTHARAVIDALAQSPDDNAGGNHS